MERRRNFSMWTVFSATYGGENRQWEGKWFVTVHPNVRSIVLPKMRDLNELLFLEFILVPSSHLKKNENENPHVRVEIPIYLCGSPACPPLPTDFLTPAEPKVFWVWKLLVPLRSRWTRKGDEVKGEGKQLVWNPKLQILLRNFYGFSQAAEETLALLREMMKPAAN